LVGVIVLLPSALDRQLQQDAGISHFEYQVLASLSVAPDRTLRMSTLADLTQAQLPRLSQVVSRLEKRGWVTRGTDPSDGRCTLAKLTDAGWEKVVDCAPGHVDAVRTLVFEQITATQVRQLGAIGRRILQALDPDHQCPG
jgi:DNA-binding MarR family transcriptional regulator